MAKTVWLVLLVSKALPVHQAKMEVMVRVAPLVLPAPRALLVRTEQTEQTEQTALPALPVRPAHQVPKVPLAHPVKMEVTVRVAPLVLPAPKALLAKTAKMELLEPEAKRALLVLPARKALPVRLVLPAHKALPVPTLLVPASASRQAVSLPILAT